MQASGLLISRKAVMTHLRRLQQHPQAGLQSVPPIYAQLTEHRKAAGMRVI
jgi:hypothetical protein